MPKRKRIPSSTESQLLTASARRCCVCFGLHGDFKQKRGQITHLDHDSSNYKLDNLAWMCLADHDKYDSTTRQSKGLTRKEVKQYRELLYKHVAENLPGREPRGAVQRPKIVARKPPTAIATGRQEELKGHLGEFIRTITNIGVEARRTQNIDLAQERFARLKRKIQNYLTDNISQEESERFYSKMNPRVRQLYDDSLMSLYKEYLEPAIIYLQTLIEAIENNDSGLIFR